MFNYCYRYVTCTIRVGYPHQDTRTRATVFMVTLECMREHVPIDSVVFDILYTSTLFTLV